MPLGKGYWISPEGEIIEINEHYTATVNNPCFFKVPEETLKKFPKLSHTAEERKMLLSMVIQKGFIRIRDYKGYHIDLYNLSSKEYTLILEFLNKINADREEFIYLGILSKNKKQIVLKVKEFKKMKVKF